MNQKVYVVTFSTKYGRNAKGCSSGIEKIFSTRESAGTYINQIRDEYRADESIVITREEWGLNLLYYVGYQDERGCWTYREYEIYEYELAD